MSQVIDRYGECEELCATLLFDIGRRKSRLDVN